MTARTPRPALYLGTVTVLTPEQQARAVRGLLAIKPALVARDQPEKPDRAAALQRIAPSAAD